MSGRFIRGQSTFVHPNQRTAPRPQQRCYWYRSTGFNLKTRRDDQLAQAAARACELAGMSERDLVALEITSRVCPWPRGPPLLTAAPVRAL
jgi:hypothetical protein